MITSTDLDRLPPVPAGGSVVSIGVFDGVHLGHQAILERNVERSRELGAQPTVVTFRSHPKRVLLGREPRTLTGLDHRLELFRRAGVEHTLVLTFDERLRSIEAADFVRGPLVEGLGARSFVLGFDSKFGRDRRGTPALLEELGLDVEVVPKVLVDERAVSSTAIREAVELGDLAGARRMLGRPVGVMGNVVRGLGRGRELGFPTANLDLHHELHPPVGVYACRARVSAEAGAGFRPVDPRATTHPAVANVGLRPTLVEGAREPLVEVHLLGFEGDLYERTLELEFVERLRDERRFPGPEALREQIGRDLEAARKALGASAAPAAGTPQGRGEEPRHAR